MNYRHVSVLMVLLLVVLGGSLSRCNLGNTSGVKVPLDRLPFLQLSDYNFFTGDLKALSPNEGVLPYDLNTALFTDYAEKARFVWMPEGTAAAYHEQEAFEFPVGAVLIKNFYYSHDQRDPSQGRRIMETRLLVNTEDGWEAYPYVWNKEQTNAHLEVAGETIAHRWTDHNGQQRDIDYMVPNKIQCKGCHVIGNKMTPIGPKARNLNGELDYAEGTMNQLEKWASMGYLTGFTSAEASPRVPVWNDEEDGSLDKRARAYLDVNCAHCHNAKGPAFTSGMFLEYYQDNMKSVGICKIPVSAGKGAGQNEVGILPGHPGQSILTYRMASTDPGIMMPELGRTLVHEEGLQLIRDWIAAMPEKECR